MPQFRADRLAITGLCLVVAAGRHGWAQSRSSPPAQVVSSAHCLVAAGTGFLAEGARYQASFRGDAVDFVPALGAGAPTSPHLRLRLLSIGRAGTRRQEPTAAAIAPVRDGDAVVYVRGEVQERFAVRPEGLALSLRFPARIPGQGDLVVRYAVDTTLPFAGADATGLHYALPGLGGVGIGAVTGIAADGHRADGAIRQVTGGIELCLPGDFVDDARYPLVLDPLIGPELQVTTANDVDSEPDAAFDASTGRYLVVWRRRFAADRNLVRGQLVDAAGGLVGGLLLVRDAATPTLCQNPGVANVAIRDRFLVAWSESASLFVASTLQCCAVDAATGAISGVLAITGPGVNAVDPRIAGENGIDDEALVVWSEARQRLAIATITLPTAGSPTIDSTATVATGGFLSQPKISRSHDASGRHLVVWQDDLTASLDARTYDRELLAPGPVFRAFDAAPGEDFRGVAVDGDGARFVLAWAQTRLPSLQRDLRCVTVRADLNNVLQLSSPIRDLENSTSVETLDPAVAFLGPKFTVAWTRVGNANTDVEGIDLAPDCQDCGTRWAITGSNVLQGRVALAAERAGGGTSTAALLVCADAGPVQPFATSRITSRRFDAFGPGLTPVTAGPGCGNGGLIGTAGGPFVLANDEFRIVLQGAPAGALAFVDVGFPGHEIPCGSCTFINGFVLQLVPLSGSSAFFRIVPPCVPAQLGTTLAAQWLVFGAANSPCPSAPGLVATARLHLTLSE
ncbi:MAG: hypothetical protein IPK26_10675 [Planctomycetes bacterium]|nr:hypothetical protein [Planctomycetota bacterium]